ncbi:MAG TPA: NYN domain-containing protein [Gemmataceae bacterium]|nr:NYN domain-containing protein [Gemmataceae bacterium]
MAFFDGQNLFHAARDAFGYGEPNYDAVALSRRLCADQGWQLEHIRFYTGVPGRDEDPGGYSFWLRKLQGLRNAGVEVIQRTLRYRQKTVRLPLTMSGARRAHFLLPDGTPLVAGTKLYLEDGREVPDGTVLTVRVGEEKGIDVRLALDVVGLALARRFDVALLFTQDQDLAEAAREVQQIARRDGRTVEVCSAYPEGSSNAVGVHGTRWIKIDGATYAACLDRKDYRQGPRRRG